MFISSVYKVDDTGIGFPVISIRNILKKMISLSTVCVSSPIEDTIKDTPLLPIILEAIRPIRLVEKGNASFLICRRDPGDKKVYEIGKLLEQNYDTQSKICHSQPINSPKSSLGFEKCLH